MNKAQINQGFEQAIIWSLNKKQREIVLENKRNGKLTDLETILNTKD